MASRGREGGKSRRDEVADFEEKVAALLKVDPEGITGKRAKPKNEKPKPPRKK